jgi:hypothetical protein
MASQGRIDPKRVSKGTSAGGQFAEETGGATNIPTAIASENPTSPLLKRDLNVLAKKIVWDPFAPIWPKRENIAKVLKETTNVTPASQELMSKTYRSIYSSNWRSRFFKAIEGSGSPLRHRIPESEEPDDATGWQWRKEAMAVADEKIKGATPLTPAELKPGMVVHSKDHSPRTVRKVDDKGEINYAFQDPRNPGLPKTMRREYFVWYTDGNPEQVAFNHTFIYLPELSKE